MGCNYLPLPVIPASGITLLIWNVDKLWVKFIQYSDVIMGAMASQITCVSEAIVHSSACSDADQRKQQSSALLAFVRGIRRSPVNSPHKGTVTRTKFHSMTSSSARYLLTFRTIGLLGQTQSSLSNAEWINLVLQRLTGLCAHIKIGNVAYIKSCPKVKRSAGIAYYQTWYAAFYAGPVIVLNVIKYAYQGWFWCAWS